MGAEYRMPRARCLMLSPDRRTLVHSRFQSTYIYDLYARRENARDEVPNACTPSPQGFRVAEDRGIHDMLLDAQEVRFLDRYNLVHAPTLAQGALVWNAERLGSWRPEIPERQLAAWSRITSPGTNDTYLRRWSLVRPADGFDALSCFSGREWAWDPTRRRDRPVIDFGQFSLSGSGEHAGRLESCRAPQPRTGRELFMAGLTRLYWGQLNERSFNDETMALLEQAARRGYRAAILAQGVLWDRRFDRAADRTRAAALMTRAWDQGVIGASVPLAQLTERAWFENRNRTPAEAATVRNWWLRAACARQPEAFTRLAAGVDEMTRREAVVLFAGLPADLGSGFPMPAAADARTRLVAYLAAAEMLTPLGIDFAREQALRRAELARRIDPAAASSLQLALERWTRSATRRR